MLLKIALQKSLNLLLPVQRGIWGFYCKPLMFRIFENPEKNAESMLWVWRSTHTKLLHFKSERNWVFATNSDFIITISLEPNVVDLRYFKLWILLTTLIWVWNITSLHHRVLKILGFKYLILFQRLNSFVKSFAICLQSQYKRLTISWVS